MRINIYLKSILVSLIYLLLSISVHSQGITVEPTINNETFNTCNSFIIDSGGQGGAGYDNNQNITFTICSDTPGDQVSVTYNLFNLSTVDTDPNPNVSNADQMLVFDGINTDANFLGNYYGTELQGVVIQATPQNETGCLTFQFISNNTGTGNFTGSASCNTPCATPQAGGFIVDGITNDSIRVCINEPVVFQESGSYAQDGFNLINYTWDFMDGSSESTTVPGAQIEHSFSAPGQYLVQLFVQDDNDDNVCINSNFISLQVFVATIPSFEGFPSDQTMCIGEELVVEVDPTLYPVTWDGFNSEVIIENGCMTDDALGIAQNVEIFQMGFLTGTNIESIEDIESICLTMEHSFMGDLVIYLTCPNGQQVTFHQQGGGGTQIGVPNQEDNIDCDDVTTQGESWEYCFTTTADQTWVEWVDANAGGTLPEGDYESVEPLDQLIGCPTNGIWTLSVVDNWAADDGQVVGFQLNLDPSLYPEVVEFTPVILHDAQNTYWHSGSNATIIDSNADIIEISPTAPGQFTYNYTVLDDFGCQNDSSFVLTVFEALSVTAPDDLEIACDVVTLQAWYEGYPTPECSNCVENETYCYSDSDNFTWTFCTDNPGTGASISFTFLSGEMENFFETFTVYNGPDTSSPLIEAWSNGNASGKTWVASSGCITVTFSSDGSVSCNTGSYGNWIYSVQPEAPAELLEWAPDGYIWEWSPALPLNNANLQAPTIVDLTQQTTFTVTGYPVGHPLCSSSDQVVVSLSQNQDAGDDNNISVCLTAEPFDMRDSLNGNPFALGEWMTPDGLPLADHIFDPNVDAPGVYIHYIPDGCDEAELTIEIIPYLEIESVSDTAICEGGLLDMKVVETNYGLAPYNYFWTYNGAPAGNSSYIQYSPQSSGDACVSVSDGCGYNVDHCFYAVVYPSFDVTFTSDTSNHCWPHNFVFTNTSDPALFSSARWEMEDNINYLNTTIQNHSFAEAGSHEVVLTLTNPSGCSYTSSMTVDAWNPPIAGYTLSPQPTDVNETLIQFNDASVGDIANWNWIFGNILGYSSAANPTFDFPNDKGGIYPVTLKVTDIHNCDDVIDGTVVINDLLSIYVPNTFTPNGDGVNDVLFVEGADIDPLNYHFMVFDRYGDKIYESRDYTMPWVGDVHGGEYYAPNGAYNWRMVVHSATTGVRKELSGVIAIVR